MRASSWIVLALAAGVGLPGAKLCQSQIAGQAAATGQMPASPLSHGCPVNLFAERRAKGQTLLADQNNAVVEPAPPFTDTEIVRKPKGGLFGVRVTLNSPEDIRSVDVLVHAVPVRAGATLTSDSRATVARRFHLRGGAGTQAKLAAVLWVHDVAGVESVSLDRVEFASGRVWHASQTESCVAAPSLYLAVEKP